MLEKELTAFPSWAMVAGSPQSVLGALVGANRHLSLSPQEEFM